MLQFKTTRGPPVVAAAQRMKGSKMLEITGERSIGVLKYKNTHWTVFQENRCHVRGFSAVPCHSQHSQASPAKESWARRWQGTAILGISASRFLRPPQRLLVHVFLRADCTHVLCGSRLEGVIRAASISCSSCRLAVPQWLFCYALWARKGL